MRTWIRTTIFALAIGVALVSGCGGKAEADSGSIILRKEDASVSKQQEEKNSCEEQMGTQDHVVQKENTAVEKLKYVDAWGEWHETTVRPDVEKHDYHWDCLKNDGTGEIAYKGDSRYELKNGIDVSHHQGNIDWEKVRADGYDFVFLRIAYRGYGELGSLNVDKMFHSYMRGAQEAGLEVGGWDCKRGIFRWI